MSEAAGEYARSKKTPDACRGHDSDDGDGDGDGNDGNGDGVTMVGGSSS